METCASSATARPARPRRDEQAALAAEQSRRIEAAAAAHDIVIADTTALMIAVYSEQVFGDRSLYAAAEAWQREHVRPDAARPRSTCRGRPTACSATARTCASRSMRCCARAWRAPAWRMR